MWNILRRLYNWSDEECWKDEEKPLNTGTCACVIQNIISLIATQHLDDKYTGFAGEIVKDSLRALSNAVTLLSSDVGSFCLKLFHSSGGQDSILK